jgi:hypothetical protein
MVELIDCTVVAQGVARAFAWLVLVWWSSGFDRVTGREIEEEGGGGVYIYYYKLVLPNGS